MSPDLAFSIGLLAGWLALVVWLVWKEQPRHDCHNVKCERYVKEHERPSTMPHDPSQRGGF